MKVGIVVADKEILIAEAITRANLGYKVYTVIDLNDTSNIKILNKTIKKNNVEKDIIYNYVGGYTLTFEGEIIEKLNVLNYMISVTDGEKYVLYTVDRKDINKLLKTDCKCLIAHFKRR